MSSESLAPLTGHRSDVQVLRGLAVLLVVMYHAKFVFSGGYIGVDVFFVISGFVIGRLLIAELLTTDQLSFRSFYARRFRRILPALALMLVVVVLAAPLLAPIAAGSVTNATAAASALFSANFYLYAHNTGGYFATASTLNPLLHTWSLAVEEQFYLAIPALLFATWRLTTRRTRRDPITTARILVAFITAASLALCIALSASTTRVLSRTGLDLAYFSPFTRAWEFCVGLGLVLLPLRSSVTRTTSRVGLAVLGYGGIILSALLFTDTTTFPGYLAILPVTATALAIHATLDTGTLARPLTWLGDNSYGWYLWHWPLIVFAAAYWPRSGNTPLILAATLALLPAIASRRLLEQRLIPTITRTRPLRTTALLTITCIALPFLAITLSRPITSRIASTDVAIVERAGAAKPALNSDRCAHGKPPGPDMDPACVVNPDGARTIVLIGDSNATQYHEALADLAVALDARIEIATANGCPPVRSPDGASHRSQTCLDYTPRTLAELQAHPRDIVLVSMATSAWTSVLRAAALQDRTESADLDSSDLAAPLATTLSTIAATGSRTILIGELPKPRWHAGDWEPTTCSALAAIIDLARCSFPEYPPGVGGFADRSLKIETTAAETTGTERATFADAICPAGRCTQFIDGAAVWVDGGHLTREGAARVQARLLQLLSAGPPPGG